MTDPFGTSTATSDVDPFGAPAPSGKFPAIGGLRNRLLLIKPSKLEIGIPSNFKNPDGSPQLQDRLTATVTVLDGPNVFTWVNKEQEQITMATDANEQPFVLPVEFQDMYISAAALIGQCKKYLPANIRPGEPSMALGRLTKLPPKGGQSGAWKLEDPTDADKQAARAYITSRAASVFG